MDSIPDRAQIPYGYCHCGCGQKTSIAPETLRKRRHVKGEPMPYMPGHNSRTFRGAPEVRFWTRVDKSGGKDACWNWMGRTTCFGYGHFAIDGGHVYAHRFAYQVTNGPIPDGLFVCHSCDNPRCVNPKHLWLGTLLDNQRDAMEKGRRPKGEKHPARKLTYALAREIRQKAAQGAQQRELAREYHVSKGTIYNVLHNLRWSE